MEIYGNFNTALNATGGRTTGDNRANDAGQGSNSSKDLPRIRRLADILSLPLRLPLVLPFLVTSQRRIIMLDFDRWLEIMRENDNRAAGAAVLLANREFRSLYYYRLRRGNWPGILLSLALEFLYPGQTSLILYCPDCGPGLFLQHAFSTGVGAERIGANCWINQQVTIGWGARGLPTLGNNVVVRAGAKIIGGVTIGNNVVVGANAVVVKDVPDNCVVVGVPAYIVRRNGVKVKEEL